MSVLRLAYKSFFLNFTKQCFVMILKKKKNSQDDMFACLAISSNASLERELTRFSTTRRVRFFLILPLRHSRKTKT